MNSSSSTPYFPPPPGQFGRLPPQPPFRPQQHAPPYTQQAYPPSQIASEYVPAHSAGPLSGSYSATQNPPLSAAPGQKPQQVHGHAPYGPIPGLVAGGAAPGPVAQNHSIPSPAIHTAGTWPQAVPAMAPGNMPPPPPGPPPLAPAQHEQQNAGYAPSPTTYSVAYVPSPLSSVSSPVHGFGPIMRPPMAASACVSPCGTPQVPFQLPYTQTFTISGHSAPAPIPSPVERISNASGGFGATQYRPDPVLAMTTLTNISMQPVDGFGRPAAQNQSAQPTHHPYHFAVTETQPAPRPMATPTVEGAQTAYGGWPASLSMLDMARFLPCPTSAAARTDCKSSQAVSQSASAVVSPLVAGNSYYELAGQDICPPAHIQPASQKTRAVASPLMEENSCHELAGEDVCPPAHIELASQKTIAAAPENAVDTHAGVRLATGLIPGLGKEISKHFNEGPQTR
ncbi:hypothetical protein RB601_000344 [Gaeumannomyces tritici]